MRKRILLLVAATALLVGLVWSCINLLPRKSQATGQSPNCTLVSDDFGPNGPVPIRSDVVVTGLEVPWGIAFINRDTFLVTERVGRLRLVENWRLLEEPVVNLPESDTSEGGLLGIVLHPRFSTNRLFYL